MIRQSRFALMGAAGICVLAACSCSIREEAAIAGPDPKIDMGRTGPSEGSMPSEDRRWRVLDRANGRFGLIEVLQRGSSLALVADNVFQTVIPAASLEIGTGLLVRGGDHIELVPYFRPGARSVLVIGLGGGLHARVLAHCGFEVTAVEIEPEVVRLAVKHFGVEAEVVVADGRAFLEGSARCFDAIVLDAFAGAGLPDHLFTREAFQAAARRLTPEGIMAVHLIGRRAHPAVRAVARTLGEVFPHWRATRSGFSGRLEAIYLFASAAPLDLGPWVRSDLERLGLASTNFTTIDTAGAPVLIDGENDLAVLACDLAEEHRRASADLRRRTQW